MWLTRGILVSHGINQCIFRGQNVRSPVFQPACAPWFATDGHVSMYIPFKQIGQYFASKDAGSFVQPLFCYLGKAELF